MPHAKASRERGFALLIVLWSLVLIGLLTTQIIASGRSAMKLAGNQIAAAEASAAADGAINQAIYHMLLTGADRWQADGNTRVLAEFGIPVSLRIDSLSGTVNPNIASTGLLAGLFQAVGGGPAQAQRIAQAIIDWRSPALTKQETKSRIEAYRRAGLPYAPPAHDFADLSELAYVAGMPPDLLAAALPYMCLYQSGEPDPAKADPVVRHALALAGQTGNTGGYTGAVPIVAIEAAAGGRRRRAVVGIVGQNGPAPFQMLALTDGY